MTLLKQMLASLTPRTAANGKLHFDEPSAIDIFEYCTAGVKGIGPEEHPTLYLVGGDPGVGKSTLRQSFQLQGTLPNSVVLCDADIVMGRSREYHHDRQALGAQAAYEKWQESAQAFSRALLTIGFNQRWNILYEGSLDADTYFFLRNAAAQGYSTDLTLLHIPTEVLQQRIQEGKEHYDHSRHHHHRDGNLTAGLAPYLIDVADKISVYDNSSSVDRFRPIARKENNGNLIVTDEESFAHFLSWGQVDWVQEALKQSDIPVIHGEPATLRTYQQLSRSKTQHIQQFNPDTAEPMLIASTKKSLFEIEPEEIELAKSHLAIALEEAGDQETEYSLIGVYGGTWNHIFRFRLENDKQYAVRIRQHLATYPKEPVAKDVFAAYLMQLIDEGVPCSEIHHRFNELKAAQGISAIHHDLVGTILKAEWGSKEFAPYVVYKWMPGDSLILKTAPGAYYHAGQKLALIHQYTVDAYQGQDIFSIGAPISPANWSDKLIEQLLSDELKRTTSPDDWDTILDPIKPITFSMLMEQMNILNDKIDNETDIVPTLIHNDYCGFNLIINNNNNVFPLDWDNWRIGPPECDLIRVLYWGTISKDGYRIASKERFDSFIQGYLDAGGKQPNPYLLALSKLYFLLLIGRLQYGFSQTMPERRDAFPSVEQYLIHIQNLYHEVAQLLDE